MSPRPGDRGARAPSLVEGRAPSLVEGLAPSIVEGRIWPRTAYAYGVVFALGVAYFLIRMPYQISDDLEHMLMSQYQTLGDVIRTRWTITDSMRPATWVTQKLVFDLAPAVH